MKQAFLLLLLWINYTYGETNENVDPSPFGISFFVLILAGILLSFLLWKRNSFSDKKTQPSTSTNLKQKIKKRQQEIQKDISGIRVLHDGNNIDRKKEKLVAKAIRRWKVMTKLT